MKSLRWLLRPSLALLALAGIPRRLRATDDGGDLYDYQYDGGPDSYESATAGDYAWQDSSFFFPNGDSDSGDPPDDGGGGGSSGDGSPPPSDPDPAPPSDPAPDPSPAPDPPPQDPPPSDPPPSDPPPDDPPPPDPPPPPPDPPPPPPPPPPAPPAPPPFDRARMRFNALGAGSATEGKSFIATDPAGIGASPWPSFQSAPPASVSTQPVALPAAPTAAH